MNRLEKTRAAVRALYDRNRQVGHAAWCDRDYDFVCPSTETYPFQWLWDSCFHAIAMSHIDVARAKSEIDCLVANQSDDGLVSHVTFWQRERYEEMLKTYAIAYRTPYLSDCMQPPVLGEAVLAVADQGADDAWLRGVLPKVRAFYDWLDRVRDPDRDGLIATLQPDESGLDHTPKYDRILGLDVVSHAENTRAWERVAGAHVAVQRDPAKMFAHDTFVVEDVLVNVIYAEGQRSVSELSRRIGDLEGASDFAARASKTGQALIDKCWDEDAGLFWDLAGAREEQLRLSTVSSLMPLMLPELPEPMVRRLVAHLEDTSDYAATYPVPSVSMKEPSFSPGPVDELLVWRGPSWINTNWYIARGLRRHGRHDLATSIEDRSVELTEKSGFREYYHPTTGEGFGANDFSWSGLVLDMLASRDGAR